MVFLKDTDKSSIKFESFLVLHDNTSLKTFFILDFHLEFT